MNRSIFLVFLFALFQLASSGRFGFSFLPAIAKADTKAFAALKSRKKQSFAGATGSAFAAGKDAKAFSASDAIVTPGFAKASSVAAASASGGYSCGGYGKCKDDKKYGKDYGKKKGVFGGDDDDDDDKK